jgi:hypothetical protein
VLLGCEGASVVVNVGTNVGKHVGISLGTAEFGCKLGDCDCVKLGDEL